MEERYRLRESRKWRRAVSWFLPSSPPPTSLFQKETRWTVQTLTSFQSSFPWDSCKSHWKEKVGVCGWLMTQGEMFLFKRLDYKNVHASSLRFDLAESISSKGSKRSEINVDSLSIRPHPSLLKWYRCWTSYWIKVRQRCGAELCACDLLCRSWSYKCSLDGILDEISISKRDPHFSFSENYVSNRFPSSMIGASSRHSSFHLYGFHDFSSLVNSFDEFLRVFVQRTRVVFGNWRNTVILWWVDFPNYWLQKSHMGGIHPNSLRSYQCRNATFESILLLTH